MATTRAARPTEQQPLDGKTLSGGCAWPAPTPGRRRSHRWLARGRRRPPATCRSAPRRAASRRRPRCQARDALPVFRGGCSRRVARKPRRRRPTPRSGPDAVRDVEAGLLARVLDQADHYFPGPAFGDQVGRQRRIQHDQHAAIGCRGEARRGSSEMVTSPGSSSIPSTRTLPSTTSKRPSRKAARRRG